MTVTLDDVSCLLHLPIRGTLFRAPPVSVTTDQAAHLAVELFGVGLQEARMGCGRTSGPYYRYEWLEELVTRGTQPGGHIEAAVRAYLLLLLSYSIFTCKTGDRAEAKWMLLLHDLRPEVIGGFAWGAGALAYLYDALGFACIEASAQIGGYASLLQAWILFYFPRLVERRPGTGWSGGPLCGRWRKKKSDGVKLLDYRQLIDGLTTDDVCWRPFEELRGDRQFDFFSLYRGFISWGDITVPYMPERCFRQFGYVQRIPRPPLAGRPSYDQIMFQMENYWPLVQDILASTSVAEETGQVGPGYLQWYVAASLPRLLPARAPPAQAAPPAEDILPGLAAVVREGLRRGHIRQGTTTYTSLVEYMHMLGLDL